MRQPSVDMICYLHNKGVALTGLMFYDKAAYYFNEAWKTDPDREHLDAYLAAKRMELTEDAYVAFAAQNPENCQTRTF